MAEMGKLEAAFTANLSETEQSQFIRYYELLVEWNERMNLTGIVNREEVYGKHFIDSLIIRDLPEWRSCVSRGGRVADVGTGAGFPGLPLAILHPTVEFVLCDSLNKRLVFLEQVLYSLKVKNVTLVHGRAEELARKPNFRNGFDIVVARAVARLNVLLEWTSPFVKPGGYVLSYKGPGVEAELSDGRRAAETLKAKVERIEDLELPEGLGSRKLIVIRQLSPTPKQFPRKAGTASKKPLGEVGVESTDG